MKRFSLLLLMSFFCCAHLLNASQGFNGFPSQEELALRILEQEDTQDYEPSTEDEEQELEDEQIDSQMEEEESETEAELSLLDCDRENVEEQFAGAHLFEQESAHSSPSLSPSPSFSHSPMNTDSSDSECEEEITRHSMDLPDSTVIGPFNNVNTFNLHFNYHEKKD